MFEIQFFVLRKFVFSFLSIGLVFGVVYIAGQYVFVTTVLQIRDAEIARYVCLHSSRMGLTSAVRRNIIISLFFNKMYFYSDDFDQRNVSRNKEMLVKKLEDTSLQGIMYQNN